LKANESHDKSLWQIAQELVPECHPGAYNQALMDLGASICTPRAPKCDSCPVRTLCAAYESGDPEQYPAPIKAKDWNVAIHVSLALISSGKVLIAQRPIESPLWPGLWELPRAVVQNGEEPSNAAGRIAHGIFGLDLPKLTQFALVRHVVTNNKITLFGFTCEIAETHSLLAATAVGYTAYRWVRDEEIRALALSSPQKRLIIKLKATHSL
jgi:A/G-specific adenine glycosylase